MSKPAELKFGPLGRGVVHLCVDMQRMFAEKTDWHMPWLERVLPKLVAISEAQAERTLFTRFIPARAPGHGVGMWRHYYDRWASMTIDQLGPGMTEIVPELARFVPPARVWDKYVYSPWIGADLHLQLKKAGCNTVVVTGGETDVCVLSTVMGAIDWGFRVVVVTDALCSSANETHDAMLNFYRSRFGEQVEAISTNVLLDHWGSGQEPLRATTRANAS